MPAAAFVPIDIYQGEDFTAQIIWTTDQDEAQAIVAPARLDIKNGVGSLQLSLATPEEELPEGEIPGIGISSDIGLIQLHIEDSVTEAMVPGTYQYDLFVTADDGGVYAGEQRVALMSGPVNVFKRVTRM